MKIVIPTPTINGIIHTDALTRSETDDIAHRLASALAGMGIRVDPGVIEVLPDDE